MFIAVLIVALMAGGEYYLTDGFTKERDLVTKADREVMVRERLEDQPIGEYPAELSLEVAKQVAETGR